MSYQAVQWALDEAPMLRTKSGHPDTTARAVLVARAERADEYGRDSHASIVDVIWRTGFDARTIQRAQERLEAAGLLVADGTTRHGTTRWNLDMSQKRDPAERDRLEAEIDGKRAAEAARVREYRRSRTDAKSVRTDSASVRTDRESVRTDSGYVRTDATPPEPPVNRPGTTQQPPDESPSGGTLPPDPLRSPSLRSSGMGRGNESSISSAVQEPPQALTATHDRTRASNGTAALAPAPDEISSPALTLIPGGLTDGTDEQPRPTRTVRPGIGICVPCGEQGRFVLAEDGMAGSLCAHHTAQRRTS